MTIRFSVEKVFDHKSRVGLLAAGWILGGEIEPGMTLGDGTGAQTTVLGIEFESPADRATGQTTLLLERTTPSPVTLGNSLVVEESGKPPVKYAYQAIYRTEALSPPAINVICYEVTIGPPRTVLYSWNAKTWAFNRRSGARYLYDDSLQDRTKLISRAEAERIALEEMHVPPPPTEPDLRPMMLAGEAQANSTPGE